MTAPMPGARPLAVLIVLAALSARGAFGASCNLFEDTIVGTGATIGELVADDPAGCCDLCFFADGCVAWTFEADTNACYLKDNAIGAAPTSGRTSGTHNKTMDTRACQPGTEQAALPFCNKSLPIDDRVNDLIQRLELDEKILLLTARESPKGAVPRLGVPEFDWGTNCIHGVQSRCGTECPTSFPNPNTLGMSWNASLYHDMARVIGTELRALWLQNVGENHDDNLPHVGLDCWAPNININRDPRWGRNQEVVSEDPLLSGLFGTAYTVGLQSNPQLDPRYLQAVVTLKHWDAYSLEDYGDATRHNFNAAVSPFDLAGTYFPAFKMAVQQGQAKGVMCSYNALNGHPTCASPFLTHVMKDVWGFDGYVTSDSGAVEDIYKASAHNMTSGDEALGVAWALSNGTDMDSSLSSGHSSTGSPYSWYLDEALDRGLVTESEDIDLGVFNTLKLRFELGLFDDAADQPLWHVPPTAVRSEANLDLSLLATRQSMTLLQNPTRTTDAPGAEGAEDEASAAEEAAAAGAAAAAATAAAVLPFDPASGLTVAVLGPLANTTEEVLGNYLGQICPGGYGDTSCVETIAQAVAAANEGATVWSDCGLSSVTDTDTSGFAAALALAAQADVVVLALGTSLAVEGESNDRTNTTLPGAQSALAQQVLALGLPTAVVLVHGGSLAVDELTVAALLPLNAPAIVSAGFPGVFGAQAIADVLFGKYNPGGKVSTTWYPNTYIGEVDFLSMDMSTGPGRSYRFYEGDPLWAFGHGLSFTTFNLEFATTDAARAKGGQSKTAGATGAVFDVVVLNTGAMDGDEVVQCYFKPGSDVAVPNPGPTVVKQLVAFERVSVAQQTSATVRFNVTAASLALVDADGNIVSAPGTYLLSFENGNGQALSANVTVEGDLVVLEPFPALA